MISKESLTNFVEQYNLSLDSLAIEKKKILIQGIKVIGNRKDIPQIAKELGAELAVIAMPSVASKEIRDIVSYLHKAGINEIRIIPGTKEIMSRNISILDIKKIDLKDLLSREPAEIDYSQLRKDLEGKRVLISPGTAGGTAPGRACPAAHRAGAGGVGTQ
jgi:FlaA1/EpsC-like NDP-sugar epimerase